MGNARPLPILPELIYFFNNIMERCKKLLIIIATHGDERIGFEAVEILKEMGYDKYFDYLVANKKAFERNKRFVDADLNRSYPGSRYSRYYERRMAYKNLLVAKKYKYVMDIHEASMGTDDFIIVPKKRIPKIFPLEYIKLDKLLLWPNPKGPISQVLENSVELEFGAKSRNRNGMIRKAAFVMKNFIDNMNNEGGKIFENKETFYVYGFLRVAGSGKNEKLIDFMETEIEGEKFLPLLVGQYSSSGIICYKMRKI